MSKVKRLVILDLNGLLIHRIHKNEYIKCKSLLTTQYNLGKLTHPERKGNFAVWFRPNVREFIEWLLQHFHVAIWSSVMKHNILPIVEDLFPEERDRDRLLFWWNQEQCWAEDNPNPTDPKKAVSFFKRLSSVWDSAEINDRWMFKQPSGADIRDHTLLIDDNRDKVRDNPAYTSIHPRTWKLFELLDNNRSIKIYKDDVLGNDSKLMKWLEGLLESDETVAQYVERQPYADSPLEEIKETTDNDGWEASGWD